MAAYHNPSQPKGERKLLISNMKPCGFPRGFFGDIMDEIYRCASTFSNMLGIRYRFIVARSHRLAEIKLSFRQSDFYHLCGLQHLSDISIPKNRNKTIENILNGKITDTMLQKSRFYHSHTDSSFDIAERIHCLAFLERYIDADNFIRIFDMRQSSVGSFIRADYMIESHISDDEPDAYIFLRRRGNEPDSDYCIVSFFAKGDFIYYGETLYWMLKQKILSDGSVSEIYRHEKFKCGDD